MGLSNYRGSALIYCLFALGIRADNGIISGLNVEDFYQAQKDSAQFKGNPFVKNIEKVDMGSLKLFAIVYNSRNAAALINRQIVKIGTQVGDATVKAIYPDYVVFTSENGIFKLSFEGQKND